MSHYRSLYPAERALQTCKAVAYGLNQGKPPGALVEGSLILPSRADETPVSDKATPFVTTPVQVSSLTGFAITLSPVRSRETTLPASKTHADAPRSSEPEEFHSSRVPTSPDVIGQGTLHPTPAQTPAGAKDSRGPITAIKTQIVRPAQSSKSVEGSERASPLLVITSAIAVDGHRSETTASSTEGHNRKAAPALSINGLTLSAVMSSGYAVDGHILTPGGPAITAAGKTLSLAPSVAALVVDGQSKVLLSTTQASLRTMVQVTRVGDHLVSANSHSRPSTKSETSPEDRPRGTQPLGVTGSRTPDGTVRAPSQSRDLPELSVNSGQILVEGTTLALSSTITLSSGQGITRVALETNAAGQTVVVGDASMRQPAGYPSRSSQSSASFPEHGTSSSQYPTSSSSLASSSSASSGLRHGLALLSMALMVHVSASLSLLLAG